MCQVAPASSEYQNRSPPPFAGRDRELMPMPVGAAIQMRCLPLRSTRIEGSPAWVSALLDTWTTEPNDGGRGARAAGDVPAPAAGPAVAAASRPTAAGAAGRNKRKRVGAIRGIRGAPPAGGGGGG